MRVRERECVCFLGGGARKKDSFDDKDRVNVTCGYKIFFCAVGDSDNRWTGDRHAIVVTL